jgi:hypothetical protein
VRQDDTLSKQLAGMTVDGLRGLLADQSPEKALQTLVDRIVLERDLTCQIELKAVPGRQQRWPGVASLRRESSNQLLETLEEWNDYLER